jgi:LemA protein
VLRLRFIALFAPVLLLLTACGVNSIPTAEENAKARWADVQTELQRRNDLIGNLVETVKGFARQEREVLTQVTEARAKATRVR